jgi:hypothetical protein
VGETRTRPAGQASVVRESGSIAICEIYLAAVSTGQQDARHAR